MGSEGSQQGVFQRAGPHAGLMGPGSRPHSRQGTLAGGRRGLRGEGLGPRVGRCVLAGRVPFAGGQGCVSSWSGLAGWCPFLRWKAGWAWVVGRGHGV